jgi:hypothetical protein
MQFQIEGRLTEADSHRYISHPFAVPEGATRIEIDFQYSPKRTERYANLLTLSLFDPQRERGTGHRGQATQHVMVSPGAATPGYLPGPLPAGTWSVMVNSNLVNPGPPINYHLDISIGFEPQGEPVTWTRGATHPRGQGWYRGDLHGHTIHSDGAWDLDGLLGFARQRQLDFVTLTDHNTLSGLTQWDSLAADDLLTMGGYELTTFYGHALALGIRQWIEWRVRPGERAMADILREVEAAGGLFVIAHPACPGDPVCTGCCWEYGDVMPGAARVVEVWNEHWSSGSNNEGSLQLWYDWLNQGYRIYATTGTDIHGAPDPALEFAFNVVYADALSEAAILNAVRRGHHYMSSGPQVEFTGMAESGQTAMMGDALPGESGELAARWSACRPGDRVRLIGDGQVCEELEAGAAGEKTWPLAGNRWYLIEVRDEAGNMRALTNPIFLS